MPLIESIFRRILWITLASLAVGLLLAVWRMQADTRREMQAVQALAPVLQHLVRMQHGGAVVVEEEVARLRQVAATGSLRHLSLDVGAATARPSAAGAAGASAAASGAANASASTVARWWIETPSGYVPVSLKAESGSEASEAWENALGLAIGLVVLAIAIVIGTRRVLSRSLAPLTGLIDAMHRIEIGDLTARLAPIAEPQFDRLRQSFNHLAESLQRTDAERRDLSRRLHDIAEAERERMARDLHDEFGQNLTAMQLNLGWLKRTVGDSAQHQVVDELAASCTAMRDGVARSLRLLRPERTAGAEPSDGGADDRDALTRWIGEVASSWQTHPQSRLAVATELALGDAAMPEFTAIAIYRMTQEALTNVARHAGATQARVSVRRTGDGWRWAVTDDGRGIDAIDVAMQRGNGLAGMRERAWAMGASFEVRSRPGETVVESLIPDDTHNASEPGAA